MSRLQLHNLGFIFPNSSVLPSSCRNKCTSSSSSAAAAEYQTNGIKALQNINAILPPATLTAIVGPNGAGKRTLARLLGRDLQPTSGIMSTLPSDAANWKVKYVERQSPLIGSETVLDAVMFAVRLSNPAEYEQASIDKLTDDLLKVLHLQSRAHTYISELTESEQMRVRFAVALAQHPRTIVADGLTSCLSAVEEITIFKLLRAFATQNHCSIILTIHHSVGELLQHFDRVILLAEGALLFSGTVDSLKQFYQFGDRKSWYLQNGAKDIADSIRIDTILQALSEFSGTRRDRVIRTIAAPPPAPVMANGHRHKHADDEKKTDQGTFAYAPIDDGKDKESTASHPGSGSGSITNANTDSDYDSDEDEKQNDERKEKKESKDRTLLWMPAQKNIEDIVNGFLRFQEQPIAGADVLPDMSIMRKMDPSMSVLRQTFHLFRRFVRTEWRNSTELSSALIGISWCLLLATLIWSSSSDSLLQNELQITGYLFFSLFFTSVHAHTHTDVWMEHRNAFLHERLNGLYHWSSFLMAQSLFSLFSNALMCAIYALCSYRFVYISPHPQEAAILYSIFLSHVLTHSALLEACTMLTFKIMTVHRVGMCLATFCFVFAGYMVPLSQITFHLRWLYYISYTQWAFTGLMNITFAGTESATQLFSFTTLSLFQSIGMNVMLAVVARLLFYVAALIALWKRT